MKRTFGITLSLASILTMLVLPVATTLAEAPSPQLSLSATTPTSRQIGQTVGVAVTVENSDTAATKVQLRYDATKVRYENFSQTDSRFSSVTVDATATGALSITATGGTGEASSPRRIVSFVFRAEQAGDAIVAFAGTNQIQTQNCLLFLCNKVYKDVATGPQLTFTLKAAEPATPPATPAPTTRPPAHQGNDSTPSQTKPHQPTTPSNQTDPTKKPVEPSFAIRKLSLSQITSSTAVLAVETTQPSVGAIIYGIEGKTETREAVLPVKAVSHELMVSDLAPATTYRIQVTMKDSSGKMVRSTVPLRTLGIVTALTQPVTSYQPTAPSADIAGTIIIAAIVTGSGLMLFGWTAASAMSAARKTTLLEASLLAGKRRTLRRFARLK